MQQRSNRTFMELKSGSDGDYLGAYGGSNRTFMELKFRQPLAPHG